MFIPVFCLLVLTQLSHQCPDDKRIQCPCGKSGNNVTICPEPHLQFDHCEKLSHCETCSNDADHCLSCPRNKTGLYCTENSTQTDHPPKRYKRQSGARCPDIPGPKLGSIRCWSSRYERECTAKCLPGHSFIDVEVEEVTLRCQNGRWQPRNEFPQCKSDGFCELEMTGAGSYNCTITTQGTRCDVLCTGRPYVSSRYFCYPGQVWKPPLPHCIRAKENEPYVVADCGCQNGGVCRSGICQCFDGYYGNYCENANYPTRSYCSDPGRVANADRIDIEARRSPNQMHEEGSIVEYRCRRGFTLRGTSRLTCQEYGSWSTDVPSCQRRSPTPRTTTAAPETRGRTCPDPGFISNGNRWNADGSSANTRRQSFSEGSSVVYSCKNNFALRGLSLITCQPSGSWSRELPRCQRITSPTTSTTTEAPVSLVYCEDPGRDPNGNRVEAHWLDARKKDVDYMEYPQGMQFDYSCNEGYFLVGEETITCLYTGLWSNPRPKCQQNRRLAGEPSVAYCDDPGYVPNSDRTINYKVNERTKFVDDGNIRVPEGVEIEYFCNDGLELHGKDTITCLSTGQWSDPPPECRSVCGKSFLTTTRRIIRGNRTSAGDWPWQVAIGVETRGGRRPEIICGAVLVNTKTVITAAHCIEGVKIHRATLYFGKYYVDTSKDDNKVIVRKPTSFLIHPRYNKVTYDYDIAIIKLAQDVRLSDRIQPICLPTAKTTQQNLVSGKLGYVIGWGLTENNVYPDSLLMAKVPFVSKEKCEKTYQDQQMNFPITDNMYCAGFDEGNSDSCTGDSGGPMTFQDPDTKRFVLEGLVSYGVIGGCGLPRRYTVYTRVGSLMRWVRENT